MEIILALSALAALNLAWFWVVFVIATLFTIGFIAQERGFGSTISTIILGALVVIKWPAIVTGLANPVVVLGGIAGYALLGVVWARLKWGKYLSVQFDRIVQLRDAFLKDRGVTQEQLRNSNDQGTFIAYVKFLQDKMGYGYRTNLEYAKDLGAVNKILTPRAASSKASIVMWITYWPVSILVYLLRDLLVDFGTAVYRMIGGAFQRVADEKFQQL